MRSNSSIKKQKADKKSKKRLEKISERLVKRNSPKQSFESMIAYVDKFGNITSEPPVETPEEEEADETTDGTDSK
jgi:S-adenosylmethionine hydrolase